jgi:hypothetical protein
MSKSLFSLTLEAQKHTLEDAFRQLAIVNGNSAAIPYELAIPGIVHELMIMKRAEPKKDQAKRSLKNLRAASARLVKVLDELSPDVLETLNFQQSKLKALHSDLRILKAVAKHTNVHSKRSAPEKVHAYKIAQAVGWHYFCLIGKDPTVSRPVGDKPRGTFFDLLTTVFCVLGVKASADSQEKKLKKEWNEIKERFQKQFAGSEFNRQEIGS